MHVKDLSRAHEYFMGWYIQLNEFSESQCVTCRQTSSTRRLVTEEALWLIFRGKGSLIKLLVTGWLAILSVCCSCSEQLQDWNHRFPNYPGKSVGTHKPFNLQQYLCYVGGCCLGWWKLVLRTRHDSEKFFQGTYCFWIWGLHQDFQGADALGTWASKATGK